jgi:DNA gyrase/topoisomerase IV subunit B
MPQDNIQFEGQTKGKLGNAEIQPITQSVVKEGLSTYFEENPSRCQKDFRKSLFGGQSQTGCKSG